jgi:hypothetical protein
MKPVSSISHTWFRPPFLALVLPLLCALQAAAQTAVRISVDVTQDRVAISPYIYGRNNCLSDNPAQPLGEAQWQFFRDAGLRICRENGGNNATKYNWQLKLSSHPDWYNNVYAHDWDYAATSLQQNLPGVQGIWAFQLIGKAAANTTNNFNDWAYNKSQWWEGVGQNLAGGGTPAATGTKAKVEGNPALYLQDWSAAQTTGLLDHWISKSGLGLRREGLRYWSMDNEPEIWNSTHDDVMPVQLSAEDFVQRYIAAAKLARAKYPEIRLMGPVPANEWQWFNWASSISVNGKKYCWLEYFIKRIGEEQAASGIRLLDVVDLHFYPGTTDAAQVLQLHRVFFDRDYSFPEANGIHALNGGWDATITKEYIFGRCQDWLKQYLGANHGVGLSISEIGIALDNPTVTAVWYASTLGEFMRNGVEVFTPWTWQKGMWEVLHLYSRYNYTTAVRAQSDDELNVSSYATVDDTTGNVTVVLVNRSQTVARAATVSVTGSAVPDGSYSTLQLSSLPSTESFISHSNNALKQGSVTLASGGFSVNLPALSVTSVLLHPKADAPPVVPDATATRLTNVSVRARGGTGSEVFTLGFVISGPSPKSMLIRGIGPTLSLFGLSNVLANPVLTVKAQDKTVLAQNDDWMDASNLAVLKATASTLGAFGLPEPSKDSAVLSSLPATPLTVEVLDKTGGTGIVLGEAYEVDSSSSSRLSNVSARTWCGSEANALTAGFVVSGPGSRKLLIRAIGPRLADFGVTGVLADPRLRVFKQGIDMPLYQNDNWGDLSYADEVVTTASKVGAFDLLSGSKDSCLILTLPPGVYSAVVTGINDASGVALVEVYEVP